ncbi:phage tail tape measure protein [Xanthomonas oryzae]|uniref:phage tail tape measure protein n=1 Tax=Xanthomonas oryzae TaxID=347 RepID=UPI0006562D3D|nr:phage tail tape measure protein [Xanthomonas oryzae]AKO18950.1 tail protein [Xanthomonas oryzae pv. oryzicola]PUE93384.1 phage tail tape measure protein [Xanthomonas oryzae pv. oryzicola]
MTSTAATIDVLLRANTAAYRADMINSARVTTQSLAAIRKDAAQTAVSIASLQQAAAGFVGFQAVAGGVRSLIDAQKAIQQIHYGLQGATGSAAVADKAYAFVSQTAKELGLDLEGAAKSFTSMSASASANGIALRDQEELFRQLSRSATVLHLSSEQMGRATTALGQSFSKGKFQAEELRQQLGEAIPGIVPRFMQAVAKMNQGTALAGKSFDKLLQDGDLNAQKYLPAMIEALRQTGRGAEDAAKGLNAELNRLSSAWFTLKAQASGGVFSEAATASVRLMAENLDKVAGAATIAAGVVAGRLLGTGARTAYSAVAAPIAERSAAATQASEMANLALQRTRETTAQLEQARASVRSTTAWKAQAEMARQVASSDRAVAAAALEAAQRTLDHQAGAATLSANLRAQREAQLAMVLAQRTLNRAQADYNATLASGVRADAAATAAKGRLIVAQEAAAVATDALAAARAREVAAGAASNLGGMVASGLKSAGSGLLALAGGPWGAAAIAIGSVAVAYAELVRTSEQARSEYKQQVASLDLLRLSMQDTVEQYGKGKKSIADLAEEWNTSAQAMKKNEERIKALQAAVENYQGRIKQAQTSTREGAGLRISADYEGLQKARAQLQKFQDQVAPVRATFLALESTLRASLDPAVFEKLRAAARKADDVQFAKVLAGLSDIQRQALFAADALRKISQTGTDEIWTRQVARLKREQGEYQAWLATEAKKYMDATGTNTFAAAWKVLTPEQQQDFIKRREFVKADVAAEKEWQEQQKQNKASARASLSDAKQQENQYASIIDRIQKQIALDKEQMGQTETMTAAQKLQVSANTELASSKSKLTDEERRRVRTLLDEAVAQGNALAAQQAARKAAEDMLRLQKELREAATTQQQGNAADLLGIGHGSDAVEQLRRQVQLKQDYDRRLSDLNDRNAAANQGAGYTKAQYAQQLAALDSFYADALEREAAYQQARKDALADWSNGAVRAFQDYAAQAANTAELTNTLFSTVFTGLEDVIGNFVKTGKLSFSDLANSILSDLSRIAAKKMITGLLGGITGGGGTTGSIVDLFSGSWGFDAGGYTGPGGVKQPAGIVHRGEVVWSQRDVARAGGVSAVESLRLGGRGDDTGGVVMGGQVVRVQPRTEVSGGHDGKASHPLQQYVTVQVSGRPDRRTPDQIARATARETARALS